MWTSSWASFCYVLFFLRYCNWYACVDNGSRTVINLRLACIFRCLLYTTVIACALIHFRWWVLMYWRLTCSVHIICMMLMYLLNTPLIVIQLFWGFLLWKYCAWNDESLFLLIAAVFLHVPRLSFWNFCLLLQLWWAHSEDTNRENDGRDFHLCCTDVSQIVP